MEWEDVPFRPGWGDDPPEFAGRAALIHEILAGIARGPAGGQTHHIITGGRGTGKTVLLARLERHVADEWQWPIVRWAGGGGDDQLRELFNEAGPLVERQLISRVRRAMRPDSISASVPGVASASKQVGQTQHDWSPRRWLEYLGELAANKRRGVLIAVDELQDVAAGDLSTLAQALQIVTKRTQLPIALIAAGLPHTRRMLRTIPGSPFLERQPEHEIGNLDAAATRDALELPIVDVGRAITDQALNHLVRVCGGYPYAIQVIGAAAWLADTSADTITLDHARAAQHRLYQVLETQLYASRWDELSPLLQDYVRTAATLIGPQGAPTPAIAAALARTTSDLSTVRDELINRHHLLYATRTGFVAFTIPGFDQWVRDLDQDTEPFTPTLPPTSLAQNILQQWAAEPPPAPDTGIDLDIGL